METTKNEELLVPEKPKEIVVLPDECGDTLWEAVLEEAEKKDKERDSN